MRRGPRGKHCGDVAQLINAINTANSNIDADEINLNVDNQANCVYPLTVINNNTDGNNGLPSITTPITINGNQSAIRRQDGSERFRIIHVAETVNLTLRQISIENGALTGSGWLQNCGGGIFNRGELMLKDSTVSENTASGSGGGISNYESTATFTNSTISENIAGWGGGIFNSRSTAMFINSAVSKNTADYDAGGVFNRYATITLLNSTISGNTARLAGGIYNLLSTTTLTNSTISGNTASDDSGGGIYNDRSIATLTNSTISGNTASYSGGAIFNRIATVTFTNSTISMNTASCAGGIYNDYFATATLKNTISAGNTAPSNSDCFNDNSTLTADHYNLFGGDGTECNAGATDLTLTGLGKTITDVLNLTLAANGGPTQTLALVANSPAIEAADDAVCPATDQRGVSRPQGAKCDIGAFEYQKPGLIELGDFQTIATAQGIYLKWLTTSASNNAGFRLWRANLDQYGGYTNITALDNPQAQTLTVTPLEAVTDWSDLIAAGGSAECYSYLDAGAAVAGTTYFYLLEDINMGGYRTLHWNDIVSATVGQNSAGNPQCEEN